MMRNKINLYFSVLYCSSYLLIGLIAGATGPLIPIKAQELGVPSTDFAIAFIVGGIGGVIGSLTCNKLENYFAWHNIIGACYLILSLSSVILAYGKTLLMFSLAQFLISYSVITANIITTVAIIKIQKERADLWCKILYMCFSICAFLTPFILNALRITALYYFAVYGLIFAILYFLFKFPESNSELEQKLTNNKQATILVEKQLPSSLDNLIFLFIFAYATNQGCFGAWISTYGTLSQGIALNQALYSPGIYWFFSTLGRLITIPMSIKWTSPQQVNILISGLLLSGCLMLTFAIFKLNLLILYIVSAMFGLCNSSMYPLMISLPSYYGYALKTQHTSKYAFGACGTMIPLYLTGLGMSYLGKSFFIFNELLFTLLTFIFGKLIIQSGKKEAQNPQNEIQLPESRFADSKMKPKQKK